MTIISTLSSVTLTNPDIVINFSNKHFGLEHRADLPKEKPLYLRPNRDS